MRAISRLLSRARMREEGGWLMMEIMIGAVALIITGLAIYQGLDGASSASGKNRNRSTAAFLAQQDQERLRAMDASALNAYVKNPVTSQKTVQGITYNVTSRVTNVNSTGTASCTSASTLTTYLKISSTVVDPANKNGAVTLDSLLAPRASQSGAVVQIVDRTGITGVPGIPVALDQDASKNDTTDANGCAQFGYLNGSSYSVSFSQPGYVDWNGVNAQSGKPITVVPGRSSLSQFNYDLAGSITASNTTSFKDGSGATVTPVGGNPPITVWHSLSPVKRSSSGTPATVSSLFPFTSGYVVFAGCSADDPSQWVSGSLGSAVVPPAGTATATGVVLPRVAVTTRQFNGSTTTNLNNPDIWFTDQSCGTKYHVSVNTGGNTATFYLPFGDYDLCVDNGNSSTSDKNTISLANHAAGGSTPTVTVNTTLNNGFCS